MKKFTAVICIAVILCLLVEDGEGWRRRRRRRRSPPPPPPSPPSTCGRCNGLVSRATSPRGSRNFGTCSSCGHGCRECRMYSCNGMDLYGCRTSCSSVQYCP